MSNPTPVSDRNVAGMVVLCAIAALLALMVVPIVAVGGQVVAWAVFGGPPLDFDAPHNGQVVAHIDVLGKYPPNIAGIRISEAKTHSVVWDVKPVSGRSECWNRCWNLTLKAGENPASFLAGHQQFLSQVPSSQAFSLAPGVQYLFEVWDSKGRVERHLFTL
jgi:hypothetical protein